MSCPCARGPARGLAPCLAPSTTLAVRGCASTEGRAAKLTLQGPRGEEKA